MPESKKPGTAPQKRPRLVPRSPAKQRFLKSLWFVLRVLLFVQRLPFLLMVGITLGPLWGWYRVTKQHRVFLWVAKLWARVFLFLMGIRVKGKQSLKQLTHNALIVNQYSANDFLILFAYLPAKSLIFIEPSFFPKSLMRSFLHSMGWYPKESHFEYHRYQKQTFIGDAYAKAGFVLAEPIVVHKQAYESIPYALMLSFKHLIPVTFMLLKGTERISQSSFFHPIAVSLEVLEQMPAYKRADMGLIRYRRIVAKMLTYERSRRHLKSHESKLPKP